MVETERNDIFECAIWNRGAPLSLFGAGCRTT